MDFLNDYADDDLMDNDEKSVPEYEDFNEDDSEHPLADNNDDDNDNDSEDSSDYSPQPVNKNVEAEPEIEVVVAEALTAEQQIDHLAEHYELPITCEVALGGHTKGVTCVSVEPAGNRVITGSMDYTIRMFDFGGMDLRHKAFNSFEAHEGNPILHLSHSPTGDKFAVATASSQPKVFDRDGHEIITFVKGDMYLRDPSHTKGHTMATTAIQWHPTDKNMIISASLDGTVRVWDLTGEAAFGKLINTQVLRPPGDTAAKQRIAVHCCTYSHSGQRIFAGLANGNVIVWTLTTGRKTYGNGVILATHPNRVKDKRSRDSGIENNSSGGAGIAIDAVQSVNISFDDNFLVVRYESGLLLLYALNPFRPPLSPICSIPDLINPHATSNVAFSPDGRLFCCCVAPAANTEKSRLLFFESLNSSSSSSSSSGSNNASRMPILSLAIGDAGQCGIMIKWHASTNQIFITMSNGTTKVLYDPAYFDKHKLKKKGAALSAQRAPRREKDPTDFAAIGEIYNPLALPMYRKEIDTGKQRREDLKNPQIAKIPEKPKSQGPGSKPNTNFYFTNFVMNGRTADNSRAEDPREALLKMDALAKADPRFLGRAYAKSQPQTMMHDQSFEQEQEEFKKKQRTT